MPPKSKTLSDQENDILFGAFNLSAVSKSASNYYSPTSQPTFMRNNREFPSASNPSSPKLDKDRERGAYWMVEPLKELKCFLVVIEHP